MSRGAPDGGAEEPGPIVGVKLARIIAIGSRLSFAPRFQRSLSMPYAADADAVCESRLEHAAPHPLCACGFHAVGTRSELWRLEPLPEAVVLDVEISGTVVVHEFGWRGAHQSVLGVHLPARCTRSRCRRPTAGVAPYESPEFANGSEVELRPVCERCSNGLLIGPAALASGLGAETSVDGPDAMKRGRYRIGLFRPF